MGHMVEQWTRRLRDNVSESGWMESEQFLEWFNTVFVRHCNKIEGPKLLIMDNHGSHI